MTDPFNVPPSYYWGRKWDAPFTDDSILMAADKADALFDGEVYVPCILCEEKLVIDDNIFVNPAGQSSHVECWIRSMLGDVQHLEGRCMCSRGRGNEIVVPEDEYDTYRESSVAAVMWLILHGRGRFHP